MADYEVSAADPLPTVEVHVPGLQGEPGPQGIQGIQGEVGPVGPPGPSGVAGYEVAITDPAQHDVLSYDGGKFVNRPQSELVDGGNF